jgi:hypothetical protein
MAKAKRRKRRSSFGTPRKRPCKHGVNQNTGRCLKRPRRSTKKKPYVMHACVIIRDKKTGKRKASKCASGKGSMKIFTAATKAMHQGHAVELVKRKVAR